MAAGGLLDVPMPDDMYDSYATGGVVSFQHGGMPKSFEERSAYEDLSQYRWNDPDDPRNRRVPLGSRNVMSDLMAQAGPPVRKPPPEVQKEKAKDAARGAPQRNLSGIIADYWNNGPQAMQADRAAAAAPPVAPAKAATVAPAPSPASLALTKRAEAQAAAGGAPAVGLQQAADLTRALAAKAGPGGRAEVSVKGGSTNKLETAQRNLTLSGVPPEAAAYISKMPGGPKTADMLSDEGIDKGIEWVQSRFKMDTTDEDADVAELRKENTPEAKKKRGRETVNMAMITAGLAMMGGESPNAFANISKGGLAGMQQYAQDKKEMRAEDKERRKELREITSNQYARKLGEANMAIAIIDKKMGAMDKEKDREQAAQLAAMKEFYDDRRAQLQADVTREGNQLQYKASMANAAASRAGAGRAEALFNQQRDIYANRYRELHPEWTEAQVQDHAQDYLLKQMHPGGGGGSSVISLPDMVRNSYNGGTPGGRDLTGQGYLAKPWGQ